MLFKLHYLHISRYSVPLHRVFHRHISRYSVPLHRVFHSIRFKVNKGWSTAVLLFLCLYVSIAPDNVLILPYDDLLLMMKILD